MTQGPSKFSLIIILGFFAAAIFMFFWQYHWDTATVHLTDQNLKVLVAKTPKQWHKGVGGRESLQPYDGMLFLFPESRRQAIVMRDTLFPLDIIWLDRGTVIDIAPNVPTEIGKSETELRRYHPRAAASMILEVPAGWTQKYGLKIGDKLTVVSE